jgi:hypothetical protein
MIDYAAVHAVADDMMKFANDQHRGYVKHWKAHSMCVTVVQLIAAGADMNLPRLFKYVRNCLEMEGFNEDGCLAVTFFIEENLFPLVKQVDTEAVA